MNNKPTLFVNTITNNIRGKENQIIYDSRRNTKSIMMHRIDDILAHLYLNRKIYAKIRYEKCVFIGQVLNIKENYLYITRENSISALLIDNIEEIKISLTA